MKITKKQLAKIIKEELALVREGGELQNTAKGAAMALLDTAKVMAQAPSHEPASLYAKEVAKQANLIMDMVVRMEDEKAAEEILSTRAGSYKGTALPGGKKIQ